MRHHHEIAELRGLLVMRCDHMAQMLDELGLELTFQASSEVEEWLQRQGFKPGVDGFTFLQSLKEVYQGTKDTG